MSSIAKAQALKQAILDLHGFESSWVKSVSVTETFQGQTMWQGTVEVFDLHGHPTALRCYAWSRAAGYPGKRRFVAVLHEGLLNSPEAAVRAAILQEHREQEGGVNLP